MKRNRLLSRNIIIQDPSTMEFISPLDKKPIKLRADMQAVHNNTMTIFSSIAQHVFIHSSIGNIRWATYDLALTSLISIQSKQLN